MISLKVRFFDIFISLIMLVIFSPIILIVSFFLLIVDGMPIIYKQVRIGHKGKKFVIFKFRTMKQSYSKNEELRLTYFGKMLRKSSLDELPQLYNVLIKDMSMVGPRPLPQEIEKKISNSNRVKRRKILPGITGMSQISFTGKKRKLSEKINLDIKFVDNYSLYNYFFVLLKTPLVLRHRFFKNKSSIIK